MLLRVILYIYKRSFVEISSYRATLNDSKVLATYVQLQSSYTEDHLATCVIRYLDVSI